MPHTEEMSIRTDSINSQLHTGEKVDVDVFARLLWLNQCYEAMPSSSKMVVFDMELLMHKAFNGLLAQSTRHVLLSDSQQNSSLNGILSVTDFIRVMLKLYREKKTLGDGLDLNLIVHESVGKMTIRQYRGIFLTLFPFLYSFSDILAQEGTLKELVQVTANASLLDAACLLAEKKIHRLPVIDAEDGSPLFILTHKRILKFLWLFAQHLTPVDYLRKSAKQLGVGTFSGIRVVFPDTPLVDCLDILLNKGVSGLPVVERDNFKVVDMYSRFDAVGIALESQLDITVEKALEYKKMGPNDEKVVSIRDNESFWKTINTLVEHNVHRLCAVNEQGGIEGIISLSDVMNFLVVRPGAELRKQKAPKRHWHRQHTGDLNDKELKDILDSNTKTFESEHHMN